jgi:hypothetical protein
MQKKKKKGFRLICDLGWRVVMWRVGTGKRDFHGMSSLLEYRHRASIWSEESTYA